MPTQRYLCKHDFYCYCWECICCQVVNTFKWCWDLWFLKHRHKFAYACCEGTITVSILCAHLKPSVMRFFLFIRHVSGVGNSVEHRERRVSAWAQKSANNMIAIKIAHKPLCRHKSALNWTKLKHIKVLFAIFAIFAIICFHSFETLISNMRCIWLNCAILINFKICVYLAIIFSALMKH